MKIEQVYEEIKRLDNYEFIESLNYQGINLWPLLRYHLLLKFKDEENYLKIKMTEINQNKNWFQRLKLLRLSFKEKNKCKKFNSEIVFLDEYLYNTDKIDGEIYNRHMQPYYELTNEFSNSNIFTFQDELKNKKGIYYFNPWFFMLSTKAIPDFDSNVFDKYNVNLNKQCFIHHAKMIIYWQKYFVHFFYNSSTKIVLFPNFYDIVNFGLIAACKKLNIKTVDLQHGKQGKFHPIYYGWNYFPTNGYSLLPDYLWVWGNYFKSTIEEAALNQNFPKIVAGGNAWLMREKETKFDKTIIPEKYLKENSKNILIGLQPIETEYTIDYLKKLAIVAPEINLILRFHPVMQKDREIYANALTEFSNIDFEIGNKLKLVELFKICQAVATPWSTVALEGIEFGLNPYIIHPNGYSIFKDDIDSGMLFYFDNAVELAKHFKSNSVIHIGVINTDREKIISALKTVIS